MSGPDQIEATGKILEALPHGGYRAKLANGHICVARPTAQSSAIFNVGNSVQLAFHPADLSRARILGKLIP
jgi:translation initiation factor IF-1